MPTVLLITSFFLVCLASQRIGAAATWLRLPLITGYLVSGAIVGPFVLRWITGDSALALRPIDDLSLAFIAFAAGSELYLKEIRNRLKSIAYATLSQGVFTYALGAVAVVILADRIPFTAAMSPSARIGVALMAAAILVARSPSSAIAIINEMRARGPFSKTALGITVVMDAVVILSFAVSMSIAKALIANTAFNARLIAQVCVDLLLSVAIGVVIGRVLHALTQLNLPLRARTALVVACGYGAFIGAHALLDFSKHSFGWTIHIHPLLACMVAGFVVVNYTTSRDAFAAELEEVAPLVYVAFFTLVGASLALDAVARLWKIALALFGMRLLGIFAGNVTGALLARESKTQLRLGWMAHVTQAGVGLGLAKDVASAFPTFGGEFSAAIIAVIVINQVIGPPLFKIAIKAAGESHLRGTAAPDEIRDAVILGIDDQSLALARQLHANNWQVVMVDPDRSHVDRLTDADVDERHIEGVDERSLSSIITESTDAVVAMLPSDEDNWRACEMAFEKYGIKRLVVRLNDLSWSDRFNELGAALVEPASAVINVLDQFVRNPHTAALLLHRNPEHEVVQITLDDPDIDGMPLRDLRLPIDVRVLEISRGNETIVPIGHTTLRLGDEITFVGERQHLEEVVARWGY